MVAPATALAPAPASATAGVARYLEAIFYLRAEGLPPRPARLADWLGVSAPTVSEAVRRLARDELVEAAPNQPIEFTAKGAATAGAVVRRHRVLERWLTGELGLDWVTADEEAHRLANDVSDLVLERLHERLGRPSTCPHGNPIPGEPQPRLDLVNLPDLAVGRPATVVRISELAEHDAPQVLRLLQARGLVPGVRVKLRAAPPAADVVEVETGEASVHLATQVARAVWVTTST